MPLLRSNAGTGLNFRGKTLQFSRRLEHDILWTWYFLQWKGPFVSEEIRSIHLWILFFYVPRLTIKTNRD